MKTLKLNLLLIALIVHVGLYAQDCKVLKKEISGHYEGECKKGLANGQGKAVGEDSYEGGFRKGLPDGEGIYRYSDGSVYSGEWKSGLKHGKGEFTFQISGIDSLLTGYWVKDKYKGQYKNEKGYAVLNNISIPRYSFVRVAEGTDLELVFTKNGVRILPDGLDIFQSSGNLEIDTKFVYIRNMSFPFKGKVRYRTLNPLGNSILDCEFQFEIEQPGNWQITFKH